MFPARENNVKVNGAPTSIRSISEVLIALFRPLNPQVGRPITGETNAQTQNVPETCTRNLHRSMHLTKIVQFDLSAVFASFWYQKLALKKDVFYSVQVSGACITRISL